MSLKKYCRKLLKVILGNRNQASLRGWDSQYLNKLADHFHSVIDIGVANGTPELYEAFPNKKVVLIEPLVEYKTTLEKFDKTRFKTIYKALGGKPDIIDINVNRESITKSSFNERSSNIPSSRSPVDKRKIEVVTLDSLLYAGELFNGPYLVKIDTEGFELDVIKGAVKVLKQTKYVIAEVTIKERFKGGYKSAEFIREMEKHSFELFDILHLNHDPKGNGVLYADMMFINKDIKY